MCGLAFRRSMTRASRSRLWLAAVPGLAASGDGRGAARRIFQALAAIVTPMSR